MQQKAFSGFLVSIVTRMPTTYRSSILLSARRFLDFKLYLTDDAPPG